MADKAVSKFKKPAWLVKKQAEALTQPANALPDSTKTRDAISVFYRSADTEAIIGIEKERKERRRKEKKQQQERERRERAAEHQRKSIEAWVPRKTYPVQVPGRTDILCRLKKPIA